MAPSDNDLKRWQLLLQQAAQRIDDFVLVEIRDGQLVVLAYTSDAGRRTVKLAGELGIPPDVVTYSQVHAHLLAHESGEPRNSQWLETPRALPTLTARHYLQPLREGGSLPAIVSTDDGMYVVKFHGAGQGPKALIAEIICGLLARALDLPVPDLALVNTPELFGRSEPDPEIQDLLRASEGTNVGLRYLDGAFNFALPAAADVIDSDLAARIVWFDGFITNPDRTARNVNILVWQRRPYLIDHGAALYAHHDWSSVDEARTRTPFPLISQHALLAAAGDIAAADAALTRRITAPLLREIAGAVPDALLRDARIADEFATADDARARYVAYLGTRIEAPRAFVDTAIAAQAALRATPPSRTSARR